jgi:hypothetical protein
MRLKETFFRDDNLFIRRIAIGDLAAGVAGLRGVWVNQFSKTDKPAMSVHAGEALVTVTPLYSE